MKIIHINTYDIVGGAARAAYRLHRGLRLQNHDSSILVEYAFSNDPDIVSYTPSMTLMNRVIRRLRRLSIELDKKPYGSSRPLLYEPFSGDRTQYGGRLPNRLPPCDLVNLHWIAGFVDYQPFFKHIPKHTPVVWTLHDMNPFTGGCHYDQDCGRYREACGFCPQLGATKISDLSYKILKRKKKIFKQVSPFSLHIVSPSHWLADEARRSSLLKKFPISIIPHGLDTDIFKPKNPLNARAALEIPYDVKVILFIAENTKNRRKGFTLLSDMLNTLDDKDHLCLISVGKGSSDLQSPILNLDLGYLESDRLLSLVYSAADIFIVPSLQEAFGQTALEAMACGVPVVGFNTGGIADIVRPGITGLLAPPLDMASLKNAVKDLLYDQKKRESMSANCRATVVKEYSLKVQALRYTGLYENMTLTFRQKFGLDHLKAQKE